MSAEPNRGEPSALGQKVSQVVLNRTANDKLVLLCYGATAARCTKLLRTPGDLPAKQLAEAIERDPILTLQLVRDFPADSVEQAVTKGGSARVRTWLGEVAARQVTDSRHKRIVDATRSVWEHALGVAMLARDLAALAQSESPNAAFMAGLLHDIGKQVLAGMLLEVEKQLGTGRNVPQMTPEEWQHTVADSHRPIGEAIAAKWQLPRAVSRCIKDTTEYDAADRGSPVNFVVFANALVKRAGLYTGPFDKEEVGALELIGSSMLGLQGDLVNRLVAGITERVRAELA